MSKNEKKVVFSEEVDSKISGFAVVLAFLSIGIFLLIFPNYFGNKLAATIIRGGFISIGVIGLIVELSKNKSSNIKGINDFVIGAFLFGLWVASFVYIDIWWINVISFFVLILGLYGFYQGLIQIVYSVIQAVNYNKETKKSLTTDIVLLLTKILGLVLVIIQIIKAVGTK